MCCIALIHAPRKRDVQSPPLEPSFHRFGRSFGNIMSSASTKAESCSIYMIAIGMNHFAVCHDIQVVCGKGMFY